MKTNPAVFLGQPLPAPFILSALLMSVLMLSGCVSSLSNSKSRYGYTTTMSHGQSYQAPSRSVVPHILPTQNDSRTRVVADYRGSASTASQSPRLTANLPPLPPMPTPPVKAKPKRSAAQAGSNPFSAIQAANRDALRTPNPADYQNAMMSYTFEEGALYEVFTAPLRLTSIQLQRGEVITGKPAAGDTVRWVVGVNQGQNGAAPHILVKPVQAGLKTSMVVNTNKRTYLLNLSSHPQTWMAAVRWQYPQDDYQRQLAQYNAAKAEREAEIRRRQWIQQQQIAKQQEQQRLAAKAVDLDKLNFAYAIQAPRFGKPAWTPTQVFDDGRKTFIRFPEARQRTEAPALFVLSPQGELQLVNYRVQNDFYVVDRLFNAAELRVGQQRPRVVRILRRG